MKKYDQSKEAKQQFRNNLLDKWQCLDGVRLSLEQLTAIGKFKSTRTTRMNINKIANYFAVWSNSEEPGYELAPKPEYLKGNLFALKKALDNDEHSINEINSRIDELNARLKPLIAHKEVVVSFLSESPKVIEYPLKEDEKGNLQLTI